MSTWRGPIEDFPCRKETPWALGIPHHRSEIAQVATHRADPPGLMGVRRPATEFQALMEQAPGEPLDESVESQTGLADTLADALAAMAEMRDADGPRLLHVFQAHVNRGMSFQQIATELSVSKTHAHYLYQLAQALLVSILQDEPEVQARLRD